MTLFNLFSMKEWISSKIKTNIIGGATTWIIIIREDIYNNKIKFANIYVDEIKDLPIPNNKIKIWPLAVWYNRLIKIEGSYSPNEFIQRFIIELNITERGLGGPFVSFCPRTYYKISGNYYGVTRKVNWKDGFKSYSSYRSSTPGDWYLPLYRKQKRNKSWQSSLPQGMNLQIRSFSFSVLEWNHIIFFI